MLSRREFLKTPTLIALAPTIPSFLAQTARAVDAKRDSRVLVVIELNGGNDGINTVVPYTDEGYARYRKFLRLPTNSLHKITRDVGLHPQMGEAAKLLETGRLCIVQGVGYPNPSRSHFESMAIWQSANINLPRGSGTAGPLATYGWVGQALDEGRKPADGSPVAQFIGSEALPLALRSRRSIAAAVARPEDAVLTLKANARTTITTPATVGDDLASFVSRSTLDAYANSDRMAQLLKADGKGSPYPASGLASQLRVIARLLKAGGATRVFYTSQSGYDTHNVQLEMHAAALGDLSSALKAFLDDLTAAKLADRVLVLCFSEFGRRVAENGSRGTDHGTSGPVLLAGPGVRAGLVGVTPKLLDLQDGDLKIGIDFRRVYATILEEWLVLPSKPSLGETFERLPVFRA
jgi:uncharacterized protein (DUF1501 family)